jgi:aspartate carbamoyltransferase catalytic subunit
MTLTKVVLATQLQLSSLHNLLVAIQTLIVLVAPVALIAPLMQHLLQYLEENDQNMVKVDIIPILLQEVDYVTKNSYFIQGYLNRYDHHRSRGKAKSHNHPRQRACSPSKSHFIILEPERQHK